MKKLTYLMIIAGMISFISCGPGKKELEEKARQDSVAQAEKQKAFEDSVKAVLAEQARIQDSIINARSATGSTEKAEAVRKTTTPKQSVAKREVSEEVKGATRILPKEIPKEIKEVTKEQVKEAPPAKQVRPDEIKPE